MKVLLEENLDHALRTMLGRHEVVTVAYMGWAGLKNGELLRIAEDNGVQVLLTGDQTLHHQKQPSRNPSCDRQRRPWRFSGG
jgi:hypothetical protein